MKVDVKTHSLIGPSVLKENSDVKPSELNKRWQTLKATTQRMIQSDIMPISRQYRADRMFEQLRIKGTIFTDTRAGRYKYLDRNHYVQVFSNKNFFADAYPIYKNSLAG